MIKTVFGSGINKIREKGVTILEGLVATAIVGIGFIAIFNMVTYSVQSIDVSSERTKANYLMHMVAEDIIGHKNSEKGSSTLKELLVTNRDSSTLTTWNMSACKNEGTDNEVYNNAYDNIITKKWNDTFSKKRLKCKSSEDSKHFKVVEVCTTGCEYINSNNSFFLSNGTDKIYYGKVQSNLNDGRKKNYLFFRID